MRDFLERFLNPIAVRELQGRFRSKRAFWVLAGFVTLQVIGLLWYMAVEGGSNYHYYYGYYENGSDPWVLGGRVFSVYSVILGFVICIFVPALSANVIALEKEKKTLEFLELTRLTPREIVYGKLIGSVLYLALLVLASMPIVSLTFVLGGVSPEQIGALYLFHALVILTLGTIGITSSVLLLRSTPAIVGSYIATMPFVPFVVTVGQDRVLMNMFEERTDFFGKQIPTIAIGIVMLVVGCFAFLHLISGYLKRPDVSAHTRERYSLLLTLALPLVAIAGLIKSPCAEPHYDFFFPLISAQIVLLSGVLFLPMVSVEGREERVNALKPLLLGLILPWRAFNSSVMTIPGFVLWSWLFLTSLLWSFLEMRGAFIEAKPTTFFVLSGVVLATSLALGFLTAAFGHFINVFAVYRRAIYLPIIAVVVYLASITLVLKPDAYHPIKTSPPSMSISLFLQLNPWIPIHDVIRESENAAKARPYDLRGLVPDDDLRLIMWTHPLPTEQFHAMLMGLIMLISCLVISLTSRVARRRLAREMRAAKAHAGHEDAKPARVGLASGGPAS